MRITRPATATATALSLACLGLPATAAEEIHLPEVAVSASSELTGIADSASEGRISARQLANRPLLRPAEVMESIPGMIVTQHSGDGKANQYFLRGFNLDHGSDFATWLMGMPANMVTHAHGQGYMDLNFLIPELVDSVNFRKGGYGSEDGNFATSGSARIDYRRRIERPFADLQVGTNGYRRALTAGSHSEDNRHWLGAAEISGNDGPWEQPENLHRYNLIGRLSEGSAQQGYALTAMAYRADWRATEHVPERAISNGEIGRYGALSANDGGRTHRYSLSGEWARSNENGGSRANLYVIDYGLNLFSSPSGFISGLTGDQHEQRDERMVWGGQLSRQWLLGNSEINAGLQLRQDRIGRLGLYNTQNRVRTGTVREDRVIETATGFHIDWRHPWTDWLRSQAGWRHDRISASATALGGANNMSNGGAVSANQNSPKFGLVFGPFPSLGKGEIYTNWGRSFHSNDVRGATARINPNDGTAASPVPLLVRATGEEIGLRLTPARGWQSTLSLWRMALSSELVFIGDEGVTEPKGASHRHGLEWSNHIDLASGLQIDADLAWSQARFDAPNAGNGGRHVPNAIPLTASLSATRDDGGKWFSSLRLRYIGSYALEETGTQKSSAFWLANLRLGYRLAGDLEITADLLNLFDRKANDIEYWGGACTRSEATLHTGNCNTGGSDAIDGRLIHPLEPRTLRLGLRLRF